jgi:hypothetical protein|tara:strand:- start:6242 stop:6469 length:228 start_codon:yes stop_codon:yes gene_type:complete
MPFKTAAKPQIYIYFMTMRKKLELLNDRYPDDKIFNLLLAEVKLLETYTYDKHDWRFENYLGEMEKRKIKDGKKS